MENKYLLQTEDGTSTLFLEEYDQAMHSMSGAYEESLLKHIIPSQILGCNIEHLYVLDIGFGLGYNVLALMNEFINRKINSEITIISLEKDRCFLEFMNNIKFNDSRDNIYSFIKEIYLSGKGNFHGIEFKILFGDARKTLKTLGNIKFHAVFQDPFSPSKNPELWSVQYFLVLKSLLAQNGIITTYSSADHIRRAMYEAGLHIGRGPSVGKKREGTIAALIETGSEINEEDMSIILNSIKSVPYEDDDFKLSRETILENRLARIRQEKLHTK